MTREEARKAAEVMLAYADGKDIEYLSHKSNKWELLCCGDNKDSNLALNFQKYNYRIKKEPTYRPFKDKEECWAEMQKHQPFGWVIRKDSNTYCYICLIFSEKAGFDEDYIYDYKYLYNNYTFADGTPFGIKED